MPCGDSSGWPRDDTRDNQNLAQELRATFGKLDKVTQLLCELCSKLEKAQILDYYDSPQLIRWWKEHKIGDLKRIATEKLEAARESAIKQILTDEERKALGYK